MPIQSSDILVKYSVKTGSAGNTTSGTAAGSLGGFISTTQAPSAQLSNLFPVLTGDQNANSAVDYYCLFIHNSHASLTLIAPQVWLTNKTANATLVAVGIDPAAASAISAGTSQAASILTSAAVPAGVSFSTPTSKSTGLALGDLAPGQCRAIWFRRTAQNTGALANDSVNFNVEGDSSA
jgi:hypothetical protein